MSASRGRGRGLKLLQWLIRAVQLAGAVIILGIYIYFLASLRDHNLSLPTSVPAVTGIAGAAIIYDLFALVLLCKLAGLPATSFIAMILDVGLAAAFIYVAVANKGGASQCKGDVKTVFGSGKDADSVEGGKGKFTKLPNLHMACKLETACLAIAIILVFLFIFSALTELGLGRNHQRQKRLAAKEESQDHYGQIQGDVEQPSADNERKPRGGFLGRLFGRKKATMLAQDDPNALPQHANPDRYNRASNGTDTTAVDGSGGDVYNKYETGYGYPMHNQQQQQYGDVVGDSYEHADDPRRQCYSFENPYESRYPDSNPYENPYDTTYTGQPPENPYVTTQCPEREPQQTFRHSRRPVPGAHDYDDGIYDRT